MLNTKSRSDDLFDYHFFLIDSSYFGSLDDPLTDSAVDLKLPDSPDAILTDSSDDLLDYQSVQMTCLTDKLPDSLDDLWLTVMGKHNERSWLDASMAWISKPSCISDWDIELPKIFNQGVCRCCCHRRTCPAWTHSIASLQCMWVKNDVWWCELCFAYFLESGCFVLILHFATFSRNIL